MKTTSAEHATAIARAEQYLQGTGLRVLDQDWHYGDGRLDIIAADSRKEVLLVCVVRTLRRGEREQPLDAIPNSRVRSKRRLAVIWMREHGVRYDQVRSDVLGLLHEGTGGYTIEHVKAVG
jgi:putative endonuclease